MRVSCACPVDLASDVLVDSLKLIGVNPIITPCVIRAVYDGPNRELGEAIVEIYQHEADHEIEVQYTKSEQQRQERKAQRKADRANRNGRR